jgi:NADH-quinone oxidoreductase subunit M
MGCFIAEPGSVSGFPGVLGPWYALVAGLGLVLAAMYLLIMLGKLVWGPLKEPHAAAHGGGHGSHSAPTLPRDLTAREIGILVPLAVVCLAIGFYPKPMLEAISPSVEKTLAAYPEKVRQYVEAGSLVEPARGKDGTVAMIADPVPGTHH